MNRKITLAGLGLTAVTVGALGVGTAFASPHAPTTAKVVQSSPAAASPAAAGVPTAGDTPDNTAADVPTAGDTPDNAAADVPTAGDTPDSADPAETSGPEPAESSSETASDGPGGYADPAGNADTQQEGAH
jgi:hypothetical protein